MTAGAGRPYVHLSYCVLTFTSIAGGFWLRDGSAPRYAVSMLARNEKYRCVECGLSYAAEGFELHYGLIEHGPAYWCDRGLLCSPACSLAHTRKRIAEGTLPTQPAANPMDDEFPFT